MTLRPGPLRAAAALAAGFVAIRVLSRPLPRRGRLGPGHPAASRGAPACPVRARRAVRPRHHGRTVGCRGQRRPDRPDHPGVRPAQCSPRPAAPLRPRLAERPPAGNGADPRRRVGGASRPRRCRAIGALRPAPARRARRHPGARPCARAHPRAGHSRGSRPRAARFRGRLRAGRLRGAVIARRASVGHSGAPAVGIDELVLASGPSPSFRGRPGRESPPCSGR